MACPVIYPSLPCLLSGQGYTAQPTPLGAATLQLQNGHGAQFPALMPGQWFYAEVTDSCYQCCETVRVVGRAGDTLTIERQSNTCGCIKANARVRYVSSSREAILAIASEVDLNAQAPLYFDCESRSLMLDMDALVEALLSRPEFCTPEEP